jgi:hypothetical protein
MMKCCEQPDVGVVNDRVDMTIKTLCENCGRTFFTVTHEFWERVIDAGKAKAAIKLVQSMIDASV